MEKLNDQAKNILEKMNSSSINIEQFYEIIDSEIEGYLTKDILNLMIKKYYNSTIDKDDRNMLVKYLFKSNKEIICKDLFESISKMLNIQLFSPVFIINKAVNFITKQLRLNSVKEFLGYLKINTINIIDKTLFNEKIVNLLQLDQLSSSILFRYLDPSNKGHICIDEFSAILGSFFQTNIISKETNPIRRLKEILHKNNIHVDMIFDKINSNPPNNDFASLKDLVKFFRSTLLMDKTLIKTLLPILNIQDEKVNKLDLINSLKEAEMIESSNKDIHNNEIHIKLNDVQVYWINKLNIVFRENNLSIKSLFYNENNETKDNINLYEFSKIVRKKFSLERLNNQEIENIIKCLDINKNGEITIKELEDIIELSNSDKTIRKSLKDSLNKRDKINSLKDIKIELKSLPVKGNHEVIKEIKKSILKEYDQDKEKKKESQEELKVNQSYEKNSKQELHDNSLRPTKSEKNNSKLKLTQLKKTNFNQVDEELEKNNQSNLNHSKAEIENKISQNQEEILKDTDTKISGSVVKKISIQIDSEKKACLGSKEIENKKIIVNEEMIKEALQEIDLLEDGQEVFIHLLEDLVDFDEYGKNAVFNVFNLLMKNLPLIERGKLFEISKCIDEDKDGLIEINDLIEFLLNKMNYKSLKLSYKSIINTIKIRETTLEDLFAKEGITLVNEVNFVLYLKFFNTNFNMSPAIIKKIYDDIKAKTLKNPIQVADIVDSVNEYKNCIYSNNKLHSNKINLLDMKSFEIHIQQFVQNHLQIYGKPFGGNDFNLPNKINLEKYRQFIKESKINFQLGMSIFYLIKSYNNNKNEYFISKEDLYEFLNSYKGNYEPLTIDKIVENLENFGCPMKFCFANVTTSKDKVTKEDLEECLYKCYPNFSNELLDKITLELDNENSGLITLNIIQEFLIKYTKYGVYYV